MHIAIIRIIDKNIAIIILPYFLWLKLRIAIILNYGKKNIYGLKKNLWVGNILKKLQIKSG